MHEVRGGTGVLAAVQLPPGRVAADAALPGRVAAACRRAGVLVRPLVGGAMAVSPPLVVDDADLTELTEGFRAGLDACR